MNEQPLVTVNILSYNRKDELRNTLTKVFEQDYKNIEVIVVDNASTDGSTKMISQEFPKVLLIQNDKNIGAPATNLGVKKARGDYILILDDDSYPNTGSIVNGIKLIEKDESIGIIAFNIFNLRFNFSETENFDENPLSFVGCGALIKKKVLNLVGFYNELIFIYFNELELSARCYNCGLKIHYTKNLFIFHNQSPVGRIDNPTNPFISRFRYYHSFRGIAIFLIQFFDFQYTFIYLLKWIINRLIICIKFKFYYEFYHSIKDLIKTIPEIRRKNILKKEVQKFYKFGNIFPLIDRNYFPNYDILKFWKK